MKNFFKRFGWLILPALWCVFILFALGMCYMGDLASEHADLDYVIPLAIGGAAIAVSVLFAAAMRKNGFRKMLIPSAVFLAISAIVMGMANDPSLPVHLAAVALVVVHYVVFCLKNKAPKENKPRLDPQLAAMQQELEKMSRMMAQMQSGGNAQPEETQAEPVDPRVAAMEQELAQMRQMVAGYQQAENQKAANKKESARGFVAVMLGVYILATAAGFATGYFTQYLPDMKLKEAFALKNAGQFEAAAEAFKSLGTYAGADRQAALCLEQVNAAAQPKAVATARPAASGQSVKLTPENIRQYLNISANVTDSDVETVKKTVRGIYTKTYNGTSRVQLKVTNQSGAKFENVEIKCKLSTIMATSGGLYGWEFNTQNKSTGKDLLSDNYKYVTIALPYDGNWSGQEKLTLELYEDGYKYMFAPSELKSCKVEIVSVTGTVRK